MSFFRMLLTFSPWIAFLIIANGSMLRLKLGIIVASVLTVIMVVTRLHRGVIMWVGIIFFLYALVTVVLLDNMWTVRYMAVMANGALAMGTWVGIILKRPFTLEYAHESTDPSLWKDPLFLRSNYLLTATWAVVFSINAAIAWQRTILPVMSGWAYETISYALLALAMLLSTWYPQHVRRQRESGRGL